MKQFLLLFVFTASLLAVGPPREPAPPFTARSLDGQQFTNESLKGRVVLVQFWTTWCGYCRRDQPAVDTITREFSEQGLVVLAVSVGEPRRKVEQYLGSSPRLPKIVVSADTNLHQRFEVSSFPLYVVIDRDGKIAAGQEGAGGVRSLREMLAKAGLR